MKPFTGSLDWPEAYRRHRAGSRLWEVYKVPEGKLTPTAEHQSVGPLEIVFIGRFARLRSWLYVTLATVRE